MNNPELVLITGDIETGKTSFCLELAKLAQDAGIQLGGVISPAIFQRAKKTGIEVVDLKTWQRKNLATRVKQLSQSGTTKRWIFDAEGVAWANQTLWDSVPCDLLIVDELGPLEFKDREGFIAAFDILDSKKFRSAILVVRPSLIDQANQLWEVSRIVDFSAPPGKGITSRDLFNSLNLV
jgi:nucleoside-triphosphatase THEP1